MFYYQFGNYVRTAYPIPSDNLLETHNSVLLSSHLSPRSVYTVSFPLTERELKS